MSPPRYPIPAATIRVETRVSNSRFIAAIGEARTVEAAKAFTEAIRGEFPDATHHVYAYRVGYGASITEGMSDDGEPRGTAGRPALAVLRGANIGDVIVVIARYFGGTKLGTGGLVRAYTEAAQEALAALPRAERVSRVNGEIVLAYGLYERVKKLVGESGGEIEREEFGAEVTLQILFAEDRVADFESRITEMTAGGATPVWRA